MCKATTLCSHDTYDRMADNESDRESSEYNQTRAEEVRESGSQDVKKPSRQLSVDDMQAK